MKRISLATLVSLSALIAGTFFSGCGSKSNPTTNNNPAPSATPVYSTSAVTVFTGSSTFNPFGISFYNGNFWITNANVSAPALDEYTLAGASVTGMGSYNGINPFKNIAGLNVGPDGTIYVADTGNNQLEVFSSAGAYQTKIPIQNVVSAAVNAAGTTLYTTGGWIQTYSINNSTTPKTFTAAVSFTAMNELDFGSMFPTLMALDVNNNVFMMFNWGGIFKFDPTGATCFSFNDPPFNNASGIAVDSAGNVFGAECGPPNFIQKFTPSGNTYVAGVTFGNNVLNNPGGLTFDNSGNLYVANCSGHQILEFKKTN